MLMEGASVRCIAGHFDGGMHDWPSEEEKNSESALKSGRFAQLRGHWAYFPNFSDIPNSIREHIAESLDRKQLSASYGDSIPGTTLRRLKTAIRRRCQVKSFTLKAQGQWLREFAFDIARTKESVLDIVNAMIEFLVKESYELPAFSTLDRLGYEARAAATSLYINRIYDALSSDSIGLMDSVLAESDESGITLWHKLKEEPKRPSINGFTRFYQHSKWF